MSVGSGSGSIEPSGSAFFLLEGRLLHLLPPGGSPLATSANLLDSLRFSRILFRYRTAPRVASFTSRRADSRCFRCRDSTRARRTAAG
jgi:hypothetical protein